MVFWQYLLLFCSVLVGGGLAWWLKGRESRIQSDFLPLLLSFSGAYLLGIAAMELMPTIYANPEYHTGIWVLAGFFVQLVLEGMSQGVEHGHVHAHKHEGYAFALSVMVGLGLHALLEGIPLGAAVESAGEHHHHHHHEHSDGGHLLMGIVLHKIPAAFALALLLRHSGYGKGFILTCLLTFAALSPIGALLGEVISIDPLWTNRVLALVVGSFLHISTTIIFEADGDLGHGISLKKFAVVVLGMAVAWFTAH
ncbi:MAG: ZIP family metal transporter [Bacteroidota bacterium]